MNAKRTKIDAATDGPGLTFHSLLKKTIVVKGIYILQILKTVRRDGHLLSPYLNFVGY
jgi:hypothetical protein